MNDQLTRLQDWYLNQCNEEWEHHYGVLIDTLDNPGWRLTVNLMGTRFEGLDFSPMARKSSETNWVDCSIREGSFVGFGGPMKLTELISIFLDWIASIS